MNRIPQKIVTSGLQVTQINVDQSFKDMLNTTLETTPCKNLKCSECNMWFWGFC